MKFHDRGLLKTETSKRKLYGKSCGKVIPTNPDYPMKVEGNAVFLPKAAKRLHGCVHCEWRKNGLCPHEIKQGRSHPEGICLDRKNYLLSFSRGYRKHPSFAMWQLDFNKGMAQVEANDGFLKMKLAESQLIKVEDELQEALKDRDKDKTKEVKARFALLKNKKAELRFEWFTLWKELVKYDDKQIERETPKKLEVEHKKSLSISDIHDIMREEVVEAEFSVEEEEDETD